MPNYLDIRTSQILQKYLYCLKYMDKRASIQILSFCGLSGPFDANHNTWAPGAAGRMRGMAPSRPRRITGRPSRRRDPCRPETMPNTHVGRLGWVGGSRRARPQACELCTSDSRGPIVVPMAGETLHSARSIKCEHVSPRVYAAPTVILHRNMERLEGSL